VVARPTGVQFISAKKAAAPKLCNKFNLPRGVVMELNDAGS
jgi:hypothetical protein